MKNSDYKDDVPVGFRCAPSWFDNEANLNSLGRIVQHYIKKYRPDARRELESFRRAKSLREAIQHAGMAINFDSDKFPHQWRLSDSALQKATTELTKVIHKIKVCRKFQDLIGLVQSTAGAVKGIGELYVYDTSLRIGAHLGVYPDEVYLHRGTRVGATALRLIVDRPSIPVNEFPRELRQLEPHEIEGVLCIYKARFS